MTKESLQKSSSHYGGEGTLESPFVFLGGLHISDYARSVALGESSRLTSGEELHLKHNKFHFAVSVIQTSPQEGQNVTKVELVGLIGGRGYRKRLTEAELADAEYLGNQICDAFTQVFNG